MELVRLQKPTISLDLGVIQSGSVMKCGWPVHCLIRLSQSLFGSVVVTAWCTCRTVWRHLHHRCCWLLFVFTLPLPGWEFEIGIEAYRGGRWRVNTAGYLCLWVFFPGALHVTVNWVLMYFKLVKICSFVINYYLLFDKDDYIFLGHLALLIDWERKSFF